MQPTPQPSPASPSRVPAFWPFKNVFYGWGIVGAGTLASFAVAPMFGPTLGLFVVPIQEDMGWSRASIALAFTIGTLGGNVAGTGVGFLLDRFGARGVIVMSGLLITACMLLITMMTQPWHWWTLYGVGRTTAIAGVNLGISVAVANWFIQKRGRAIAYSGSGLRFGQAITPMIIVAIIAAFSWQHAFGFLSLVALLFVVVPCAILVRRRPEDMGLHPDGLSDAEIAERERPRPGDTRIWDDSWTLKEAFRTKALWLLIFATGGILFVNGAVNLHVVANFQDRGLSIIQAASIATLYASVSVVMTFVFGFLTERFHVRYAAMAVAGFYASAMVVAIIADTYLMAVVFGLVYGTAVGGWTTAERMIFAEYYGRRYLGSIRGFSYPVRALISPFGAVWAGYVVDSTGSYELAFTVFGTLALTVVVAMLIATPPRRKQPTDAS